jgi:hypothetical protein
VMCIHSDAPDIREGVVYTVTKTTCCNLLFCVYTGYDKYWQMSYNFTLHDPSKTYQQHHEAEVKFEI